MRVARERCHVGADLGDQDLGDTAINSRYRIQLVQNGLMRARQFRDPLIQPGDELFGGLQLI